MQNRSIWPDGTVRWLSGAGRVLLGENGEPARADNILVMLGRLIGEDVKIVVDLNHEVALVKADRGQVEQVVMNLAVNARDAMPNGGGSWRIRRR